MSTEFNLKINKIIYNIDQKLEYFELEKLVESCEVDFFIIDTACFTNVKDYQEMINNINYLNEKFEKNIGTIVELRGRKIIAELNTETIKSSHISGREGNIIPPPESNIISVFLKKGDKVAITNHSVEFNKERHSSFINYEILIKYKDLYKMLKIGDQIIVNDNKCSLKVDKIFEISSPSDEDEIHHFKHESFNLKILKDELINDEQILEKNINLAKRIEPKIAIQHSKTSPEHKLSVNSEDNISIKYLKKLGSPRQKVTSLFNEKKYEILCSVDYDCILTKNFYLYFPTLNFKQHQVDVLSPREVAEISTLENLKVNFINITISDKKDIESLKNILGEESKLKIIASITNVNHLENIESIYEFADAILISRTFQIINKENKNKITRLTNFLIAKSLEHSKPIFSFIDLNIDLLKMKKRFYTDCSLIMYNLIEGFDGFIINCQNQYGTKIIIQDHVLMIKDLNNYLKYNFRKGFIDVLSKETEYQLKIPYIKKEVIEKDFFENFIFYYSCFNDNSLVVYYGSDFTIFKKLVQIKNKVTIVLISSHKDTIMKARLFSNVVTIDENYTKKYCNLIDANKGKCNLENYIKKLLMVKCINIEKFNIFIVSKSKDKYLLKLINNKLT